MTEEPAANPVEKAILYRILKLLILNIQLLFVFDGPRRPWKKGKTAGMIKYQDMATLRRLLDLLRVPHHRAPAEAEAECVRLQQEGIVDAVWSEDSDSLMFGCTLLIRNLRDKDKKSDTHVRVYRATDLWDKKQLDRNGLVLIAMLAGGDYDPVGVRGCGANLAYKAAKRGLGNTLCQTPDRELFYFRDHLHPLFRGKDVEIPPGWPKSRHLNNYRNPKVSSHEELHDLNALRNNGWDRETDQSKLRTFLRERFQIWTKGYMKHILPVLLVRALSKNVLSPMNSNPYSVELVRSRKQQSATECEDTLTRKIKFLPHNLVDFNLTVSPEDEDWSKLATKDTLWKAKKEGHRT
ncbi:Flap endonuclease 1 [Lasiodiplodia theobromae]|uniref:Flap endonuclease 1 n=1 Tax=Lasiodiplodia theobromae TaxID=45133 RepID=A0A5N5DLR8_9PEZI|nr:Flap endonuclease 1 [Lasiodiplodia theobromae]